MIYFWQSSEMDRFCLTEKVLRNSRKSDEAVKVIRSVFLPQSTEMAGREKSRLICFTVICLLSLGFRPEFIWRRVCDLAHIFPDPGRFHITPDFVVDRLWLYPKLAGHGRFGQSGLKKNDFSVKCVLIHVVNAIRCVLWMSG